MDIPQTCVTLEWWPKKKRSTQKAKKISNTDTTKNMFKVM